MRDERHILGCMPAQRYRIDERVKIENIKVGIICMDVDIFR
jgi:hypothetical protein